MGERENSTVRESVLSTHSASPPVISQRQNLSLPATVNSGRLFRRRYSAVVSVTAEDVQHRLYQLPIEFLGKVPLVDWLWQHVFACRIN